MKKYIFIILIVLIISLFIKIPEYKELNNLKIIEGIGLECINNNKILYLKEIIPEKDDNGIEYNYKYHKVNFNNLNNKYYLKNTKYIITNCSNTIDLINNYKLKPIYIYHTNNDIKKELSKNT